MLMEEEERLGCRSLMKRVEEDLAKAEGQGRRF